MQARQSLKLSSKKLIATLMRPYHAFDEPCNRVVVLCYHSVHPTKGFSSATPALFEQHLQWLKQRCELIRFTQIFEALKREGGERPSVAITFDDGYADNYEYAFPLLQKYGIPATFFVTVGLLEKDPNVVERFQMLRQSGYDDIRPLEWSQVSEMRKTGMEFGNHTYSHPNLARLDRLAAQVELTRSKEALEQHMGEPSVLLAYPFGKPRRHFTLETTRLAAEAEYEYGGAVLFRRVRCSDSKLAIPRFLVTKDELEILKSKVYGEWDFIGSWQQKAPLWAAKVVSPGDFLY